MAPLIAPHPVPHNQYNFSAGRRIRELQASNEILISDIARDTRVKSISNSRIKDDLGRSPNRPTADRRRRYASMCTIMTVGLPDFFAFVKERSVGSPQHGVHPAFNRLRNGE